MAEDYSCANIQVLRGLEAVRRRPGMYIGDTSDGTGLHHMLYEVIDWAANEHVEGSATYVRMAHVGHALVVEHDGQGMVPEPDGADDARTIASCFERLSHSRWRVGPCIANALSAEMQVTTHHDGHAYRQSYVRGEPVGGVEALGPSHRTGVRVRFVPDETVFGASRVSRVSIRRRLRLYAACHPRLTLLHDERAYRAPDGFADLVRHLARGARWLHDEPVHLRASVDDIAVDAAMLWTDRRAGRSVAMVGDQRCPQGSHVSGLMRGIQDGLDAAGAAVRDVYPTAFREVMFPGLVWAVHVRMPSPRIQGPRRERLNEPDAGRLVRTLVSRGLAARLTSNPGLRATLFARLPHANENGR